MKKQEKKFVLAALVLLAITGLLALAGCKNDTVPEPTRYTVKFDKNAEDASGEMQSQIFTEGVEQELSVNQFKRATYTFSGWSEDKAATAPTYKDKAKFKATKDTTLYAVWTDNGTVSPVAFSLPDGTKFYFGESIEVSLETTTEGATIHYQLGEGEWKIYEKPFTVSSETVVTAYATKDGLKDSEKTKSNYLRQLISISVTPPTRTVYSVGESFDDSGMIVTATYDDGEERTVTGTITTDTSTLTESAGIGKTVTVSYTEGGITREASFTIDVASYQFTETVQNVDSSYAGTMTGETYKKFGDWPQTIKEEDVEIGAGTLVRGGLTYYVGNDGNYYVKAEENACEAGYKYSDYSEVKQKDESGSPSTRWFKVEPIVWRVLTTSYKAPEDGTAGNALLLAEKILTGGIPYYDVRGTDRTVDGATIYPNNYEHSAVRAWLNGLEYKYKKDANTTQTTETKYLAAGFLQTAFTQSALGKIARTTVDNSADRTTDKVFLLSQQEASSYGFAVPSVPEVPVTTDYAKATGVYQIEGYGYGYWWLRSPYYDGAYGTYVDGFHIVDVRDSSVGVVPALSISLQ